MDNPNIAFFSPLLENSGWGEAGRAWLLSLNSVWANLSARPILFNSPNFELTPKLKEICNRPTNGANVVIQHLFPHLMFSPCDFIRNIGLFVTECSNFRGTRWVEKLNQMDEIWVSCQHNFHACKSSGITKPIKVIPHAFDLSRYSKSVPKIEQLKEFKDEGLFIFYTIGEFVKRKNYEALFEAFHAEFSSNEPVALVVKTSFEGASPDQVKEMVSNLSNEMAFQTGIRRRRRPVLVLSERFTDAGILGLHNDCDCFVSTSYAEAWNMPCFDAMALGKTPIATNYGGHTEYLMDNVGWAVQNNIVPATNIGHSEFSPFTVHNEIAKICPIDLRMHMRQAYEDSELRAEKAALGIEQALNYSYEKVGQKMMHYILGGLH